MPKKPHAPPQWRRLERVYGITREAYEKILRSQKGVCFICQKDPRSFVAKKRRHNLCVDHDHYTGEIRGLLCQNCNSMISRWLRDCPEMTERVHWYLTRPRKYGKVPDKDDTRKHSS